MFKGILATHIIGNNNTAIANYWVNIRLINTDPNFSKKRGLLSRDSTIPIINQIPKSNAGTDKEITLPVNSLSMTGSGTDADGIIASYQWNKIAGPSAFASNRRAPSPPGGANTTRRPLIYARARKFASSS